MHQDKYSNESIEFVIGIVFARKNFLIVNNKGELTFSDHEIEFDGTMPDKKGLCVSTKYCETRKDFEKHIKEIIEINMETMDHFGDFNDENTRARYETYNSIRLYLVENLL